MRHLLLLVAIASAFCLSSCSTISGPSAEKYFAEKDAVIFAKAAADGDTTTLSRLLAAGINVNARGRAGMTPLIWALLFQSKKGFAFLLEHGADANLQLTDTTDDLVVEGNSAMSFASMHEDIWYLQTVLHHGGDPNLVNATRSHTPVFSSMFSGRTENAKLLIAAGANLDWQNRDGYTPLMSAIMINQLEIAYAMLGAGADPTIHSKSGHTLLTLVRETRTRTTRVQWCQKIIENLTARGLDVEHGH